MLDGTTLRCDENCKCLGPHGVKLARLDGTALEIVGRFGYGHYSHRVRVSVHDLLAAVNLTQGRGMVPPLSRADIIAFQDDIRDRFLRAEIRHPIHLCDPHQLDYLLPVFQRIQPVDWLFTSYRGIYHWLLKGVPPEALREFILAHGTMGFCDRERGIVSSAIVGGCLPIALGVALGLKCQGKPGRVWCFVGDMASETGAFAEASRYAAGHDLPLALVVEDNGLSTNTPTERVWGSPGEWASTGLYQGTERYLYRRDVPHVGAGQFVTFS